MRLVTWHDHLGKDESGFGPVDDTDAMDMISSLTDDLVAYADGRPLDGRSQAALDDMILDYIDGELDGKVAYDLETSMRLFPNVARLVADKTEEAHLQNRLSMYFDGELDPKAGADTQRLIEGDPGAAKLARQIRQGGDYLRVVLQPIPGQHLTLNDPTAIKAELIGASDVAPSIARFSILINYVTGLTLDQESQDLLDHMIIRYLDGTLDRFSTFGLEASMRLVPSVARFVADKSNEQPNLSGSTRNFRYRTIEKRAASSAQDHSRYFESL